nr:SAM and SH3 domain-containing protein [Ipomoea batatas]
MGSETMAKQVQVKVKEMIADILIDNVVEKFQDWVRGYKHYYYFVFFILLFLGGCCYCCCGKGAGKTMKAPGGSGRMARAVFEKNPKSYFKNLRQRQV